MNNITDLRVIAAIGIFIFTKPQPEPKQAWEEACRLIDFIERRIAAEAEEKND